MTTSSHHKTLLIDAGNSRLKWALSEGTEFIETGSAIYVWNDLQHQLSQLWAGFSAPEKRPGRIVLANVAGSQLANAVAQWATALASEGGAAPVLENVIPKARAFGVINAYAEPQCLGVDRWAALVAAKKYIEGAACVVDCGTALTVDILTAAGKHQGGIIVPGIKLMKQSLVDNTDAIKPGQGQSADYLGCDTWSAIHAGALAATSGAVNQVLARARDELGEPITVVITGGDANELLPRLLAEFRHEPHWVLKGLAVLAEGEA